VRIRRTARGWEVRPSPAELAQAWLLGSESFHVYADGAFVGVVDQVLTDETTGSVVALDVSRGWFGRQRTRVAVERVTTIAPSKERIFIAAERDA
jgi:uncharacterized protein YrrD